MMATQFGKKMGATVIAVSKQKWIKDFGADYIITDYERVAEKVNELTQGKMDRCCFKFPRSSNIGK